MQRFLMMATALGASLISATISIKAGAEEGTPAQIAKAQDGLPAAARIIEASVLLRYTIESDGRVDQIEVLKGSTAPFNPEAERAVASRLYAPTVSCRPLQ